MLPVPVWAIVVMLVALRLRNNPITPDQKEMLRKALPHTDIDF